ncbi:MAG: acyltransferase [Burkholderiaceae bacterium]|nr:acyltransferase [Burkholderiaceae bacterium]
MRAIKIFGGGDRPTGDRRGANAGRTSGRDADGRLASLQALRAVAALLVVFNHFLIIPRHVALESELATWVLQTFVRIGSFGVDLFFTISGFVMLLSIEKRAGRNAGSKFLLGRALRILPLYLLVTGFVMFRTLSRDGHLTDGQILNSLLLLPLFDFGPYDWPVLGVAWSLMYEFVFYLIVGAALAAGVTQRIGWIVGTTIALPVLGRIVGLDQSDWVVARVMTSPMMLEFAAGSLIYIAWRRDLLRGILPSLRWLAILAPVPIVWAGLSDVVDISLSGTFIDGNRTAAWMRTIGWGVPAALLFTLALGWQPDRKRIVPRAMLALGDASYSLYLIHVTLISTTVRHLVHWPPAMLVPTILALCVGSSLIVYHFVERPLNLASKRLSSRRRRAWSVDDPEALGPNTRIA